MFLAEYLTEWAGIYMPKSYCTLPLERFSLRSVRSEVSVLLQGCFTMYHAVDITSP
jgi:hypothetical protein